MGLDMYLYADRYIGGWPHHRESAKPEYRAEIAVFDSLVRLTGITPDEGSPSFHVKACVGYWRKANAIHRWFVEHVQDGKDECQSSYVSRDQLKQLRASCQEVLDCVETVPGKIANGSTYHSDGRIERHTRTGQVVAQAGIAAAKMPTQSGFFFGGTDYDECYLTDLRDTVAIIDKALSNPATEDCDFEYHASW